MLFIRENYPALEKKNKKLTADNAFLKLENGKYVEKERELEETIKSLKGELEEVKKEFIDEKKRTEDLACEAEQVSLTAVIKTRGELMIEFGVPKEIVTDNGSQFVSLEFQNFCREWGIQLSFSTPRYPQANGQAESTNKIVVNTLKKRLEKAKEMWADELPGVLRSYRTTAKTSTGETPFSLTFGTEAVIPAETGIPTSRYEHLTDDQNWKSMNLELDSLDEKREKALIKAATFQQKVAQHFNKNIRARTFKEGDWVLRRVFQNTKEAGAGKLSPNWEGPYKITKVIGQGAYRLQAEDGREIGNSWNATHLKQYHF
uniref:Integrase catalytic domain-containing protein n=1 Tax=Cannabis sativa TaxID=3483 RepID=A0A803QH24_CANSA